FESPEMRSQSSEPDLHFVGDANRTCCAHMFVDFLKISRGENNLPANAGQGFGNVRGDASAFRVRALQDLLDMPRIFPAGFFVLAPVQAAIVVGQRRYMHPRFFPATAGAIEFIRADV